MFSFSGMGFVMKGRIKAGAPSSFPRFGVDGNPKSQVGAQKLQDFLRRSPH
jgi:hypothetical protein